MKRTITTIALIVLGSVLSLSLIALKPTKPDNSPTHDAQIAIAVQVPTAVPSMVAVYSEWCPSCRQMKPIVDDLLAQCDGRGVRVQKVDFDKEENRDLVEHYDVQRLPTFLFLDENGMEIDRLVGKHGSNVLKDMLSLIRGEQCPA